MIGETRVSDVIMTFGMCSVVVIDDGSTFNSAFIKMCISLNINHWCLSRDNHRGDSVERYHRFLNKTQTINDSDQGTYDIYIQNTKTSQHTWNIAAIDNKYVSRCFAAIGQEFRFPSDVQLPSSPTLSNHENGNLYCYLRDVGTDSKFALSVL